MRESVVEDGGERLPVSTSGCPRCGSHDSCPCGDEVDLPRCIKAARARCLGCGADFVMIWRSLIACYQRALAMRAAAEVMAGVRACMEAAGRQDSEEYEIADMTARRLPILADLAERGKA